MNKMIAIRPSVGRKRGLQIGQEHGIRMGRCQFVLDSMIPAPLPLREARVLFIIQGFDAIDQGIVDGLRQTVREAYTATAVDMLRLAAELGPNLVLVMNGLHVFPADHTDHVDQVRQMGIRTAIWFADDPYFTDHTASLAPHYDYVFTHELSCVAFYREIGCGQVHYLPLAVNTAVFKPMHVSPEYRSDICFIGNGFPNRITLFNELTPYLVNKKVLIAGALWEQLDGYSLLKKGIKLHWIPIEESVKYYNGAKIVINVHRLTYHETYNKNSRNIPGYSINPRTYEIAGCGTLQLTDYRHDLDQYYTPGQDIETFLNTAELIQKMKHYLRHEEDRMRIAIRGLRRTRNEHTFAHRLVKLMDIVFA
ncbi:CgeB family protein [Paenibacillus alginolyticus]|uniref:CgeB family protein n=1 Tax=Paenibacillus alginolyticus TaxID=59839 RepID=UPI001FE6CDF9|nr:glycosyltransferase [Paenibacillus frigoriresistens]